MDLYEQLASDLPNEARLGGAWISLVEPHPGFELAYNRWYEDDHFYSGAMNGPWIFSGRRFVATSELRSGRAQTTASAISPRGAGCYLSLYWEAAGHELDAERWAYNAMVEALLPAGRGFTERTHIYTAYQRYRFSVNRDQDPIRAETSLDHPFRGLVFEIIDSTEESHFAELLSWLEQEHLPRVMLGFPGKICICFEPVAFTQGSVADIAPPAENLGRRLCLLWFLDQDPRDCYPDAFVQHHAELAVKATGHLAFSGPFLPTVPGTDLYVPELRET